HLLALAQDRSRCDEMGRAAAAFVARSFSTEVRTSQIEELLRGQLEGSTVRRPVPVPQGRILPAEKTLTKDSALWLERGSTKILGSWIVQAERQGGSVAMSGRHSVRTASCTTFP